MSRIDKIELINATGEQRALLEGVQARMGKVPNLYAGMAQSAVVLKAYLTFADNLKNGTLDGKTREMIALAVSQYNGCDYCLSAHSFVGSKLLGMTGPELRSARLAASTDVTTQALLTFVSKVVVLRGRLEEGDILSVRDAGYSQGEVVEIIAHIAQTIFTNYFNHIAQTEIDFPPVAPIDLKSVA
jgi:uncharacterized peroxidase-related enzyme